LLQKPKKSPAPPAQKTEKPERCRDENAMNLFWRRGHIRAKTAFLRRFGAFWGVVRAAMADAVEKDIIFLILGWRNIILLSLLFRRVNDGTAVDRVLRLPGKQSGRQVATPANHTKQWDRRGVMLMILTVLALLAGLTMSWAAANARGAGLNSHSYAHTNNYPPPPPAISMPNL
jgi:hypothetical protein